MSAKEIRKAKKLREKKVKASLQPGVKLAFVNFDSSQSSGKVEKNGYANSSGERQGDANTTKRRYVDELTKLLDVNLTTELEQWPNGVLADELVTEFTKFEPRDIAGWNDVIFDLLMRLYDVESILRRQGMESGFHEAPLVYPNEAFVDLTPAMEVLKKNLTNKIPKNTKSALQNPKLDDDFEIILDPKFDFEN